MRTNIVDRIEIPIDIKDRYLSAVNPVHSSVTGWNIDDLSYCFELFCLHLDMLTLDSKTVITEGIDFLMTSCSHSFKRSREIDLIACADHQQKELTE